MIRLEETLVLDLLAPFLLTNLLIPRLKESRPARIVNVSSGGMYTQRLRVVDHQFEKSGVINSVYLSHIFSSDCLFRLRLFDY